MLRSIDLAVQAREHFLASDAGRARLAAGGSRPLIALSLGPYGAMLGNGAEYTGEYPSPDDAEVPISQEDLEAFHQRRLECFVGTPQWEHIDLIAFETIPRVDEITAVRGAMLEVARTARWAPETPRKDVLVSVVFPNGQNLPHPHIDAHPTSKDMDGDEIRDNECTEIMREAFKPCYDVDSGITEDEHVDWPVTAVGINCTKPHFIRELVCAMSNAMADARYDPAPHLFVSSLSGVSRLVRQRADGPRAALPRRRPSMGRRSARLASCSRLDGRHVNAREVGHGTEKLRCGRLGDQAMGGCLVGRVLQGGRRGDSQAQGGYHAGYAGLARIVVNGAVELSQCS